ncbi:MAG: type II toxin-antitoxin system death-on-curing family toxin [Pseudomonadota bacterium]|nr:type II toxin-antitoxin system death-on-curing family toxin [Pseudomonadota bacterium]
MTFLAREEILRVHAMLLELYGGAHGLRDEGLLLSALAQPESSFDGAYLHVDIPEMAAAYGFHLAQNHPFLDGNKRTALAAMLVFLELNGRPLHVGQEELYAVMLGVAEGRVAKGALAAWVRERAR